MIDTIALALNKRNLTWKVKVDGLNHDKQPYSWLEEKKKKEMEPSRIFILVDIVTAVIAGALPHKSGLRSMLRGSLFIYRRIGSQITPPDQKVSRSNLSEIQINQKLFVRGKRASALLRLHGDSNGCLDPFNGGLRLC